MSKRSGVHNVGVREFRSHLRTWLRRARSGQDVVITERGEPIARLVAAGSADPLDRLVAAGLVRPPTSRVRAGVKGKRIRTKGSVSDLVREQRR